ncbi:MAG: hypothetical protein L5655_10055 [Thermosediminibacteraceae bacterium]|nr:hypothetical protein [Thermosediminibacteraceae bacterium]
MAKFIGHGILERYSKNIDIEKEEKLNHIIKILNIPDDLKEHIIFIKNNKKLNFDNLIKNDDEVHFYITPLGG